jgi:acyl-CoA thioesterase-1
MPTFHTLNATITDMLQIISARRRTRTLWFIVAAISCCITGCGDRPPAEPETETARPTAIPTTPPGIRIVVLGDSLAAGLGLAEDDAFPAVVGRRLSERGLDVEVVNAGVSGDTSAGGVSRLDWVLQTPTDVLVVELGGNDALRGQALDNTESNLRAIVRRGRRAGAEVVLVGMDAPSNYGPDYTTAFAAIYPRVARDEGAVLVPGFVRILGENPELLQPDGLHPTAEGQQRLAEQLVPTLLEVLEAQP